MRRLRTFLVVTGTVAALAATVEANRQPRRWFVPMRYLTDARVDRAFDVTPPPPTRAEQRRPLPSFWALPGSPGSVGRGVHSSMFMTDQHARWNLKRVAAIAAVRPVATRPKVIEIRRPTSRPSTPIIESITIR